MKSVSALELEKSGILAWADFVLDGHRLLEITYLHSRSG